MYLPPTQVYILIIAIMCCIPAISPLLPFAAVAPVIFVLSISMTRDGFEDYHRHRADEELNNSLTAVYIAQTDTFEKKCWKDVKVGDIIQVNDHEWVSADIILLATDKENGVAFIDTMDLDGETNLKRRNAPRAFVEKLRRESSGTVPEALGAVADQLAVACVGPSGDLYGFDGAVTLEEGNKFPVNESHMLLRSSRLRNTKWAIGVVVYTGTESKVMLNSKSSIQKQSSLEKAMNVVIVQIMVLQCVMAAFTAVLHGTWTAQKGPLHAYLQLDTFAGGFELCSLKCF